MRSCQITFAKACVSSGVLWSLESFIRPGTQGSFSPGHWHATQVARSGWMKVLFIWNHFPDTQALLLNLPAASNGEHVPRCLSDPSSWHLSKLKAVNSDSISLSQLWTYCFFFFFLISQPMFRSVEVNRLEEGDTWFSSKSLLRY